jgi:hypothetical protein
VTNESINLIAEARRRQLEAEAPMPTALDTLALAGANIAKAMDLLLQPQIIAPTGNLLCPKMVRLNDSGQHLPERDDADPYHAATLFPHYGLIVDIAKPQSHRNWNAACEGPKKLTLCGAPQDGLLEVDEWGLVIDRRFYKPAVNPKFFPNFTADDIYWTRSECANPSCSGLAWYVCLGSGLVYIYGRSNSGLAVGCRRVPPSQ